MSTTSYSIARLYLKSASIEVPDMARLPRLAVQPEIGADFQTDVKPAWAGHIECILTISLHGKLNGKTMFMIEVGQAGVFKVPQGNAQEIARFAKETAAEVLFPYARKHLAAMAVSAGFQPVILDHVDFGALLSKLTKQPKPTRQPAAKKETPPEAARTTARPSSQQALPLGKPSAASAAPLGEPVAPAARVASAPSAAAPPPPKAPALPEVSRRANPLIAASIIAFFAAAGAIWLWPRGPEPVTTPPPLAAMAPAKLAAEQEKQKLLERGEQIIAASHARLADQAETAYTLQLGTIASADAVPALEGLPIRRALFVDRKADGSLAVLYGIFPDASSAQAAESELALQFPAGLTLRKRVVRLGGEEQQNGNPASATEQQPGSRPNRQL